MALYRKYTDSEYITMTLTESFDVTILSVIDTDPTNNIEGVAETVKCVLRFNW